MSKKIEKRSKIWNLTKKSLGIIFIIIGIISLFLPFLPGILFVIIGLVLFHDESIREYISSLFKK